MTHIFDMADLYLWDDPCIYLTWLMHIRGMTHSRWCCVKLVIDTCDMIHSCIWHDSFTYETWLFHIFHGTCLYTWRDAVQVVLAKHPFSCVNWLIHMCDMIHLHLWRDSFYRWRCGKSVELKHMAANVCNTLSPSPKIARKQKPAIRKQKPANMRMCM